MPSPSPAARDSSPAAGPREAELRQQALVEIRRILGEELAVAAGAEPERALVADLHLDSMELLTLAVGLRTAYG